MARGQGGHRQGRRRDDEQMDEVALLACLLAGKHLLNSLRSLGIQPDEILTQAEALEQVWPADWAYDAWCAWHACRIIARRAGLDLEDMTVDRRHVWRTSAHFRNGHKQGALGPTA